MTNRTKITLKNDFHKTTVVVYATDGGAPGVTRLSKGQAAKCRKALCGIAVCVCGGDLGERGMIGMRTMAYPNGNVVIWTDTTNNYKGAGHE